MGTTAQHRKLLAAELRAALEDDVADLVVLDHARRIEQVLKPTLLVTPSAVAPGVVPGVRRHTLDVWAVEPTTTPGASDDRLDALLELVLDFLEGGRTDAVLERAERDTYTGTHPAWRITCTRED